MTPTSVFPQPSPDFATPAKDFNAAIKAEIGRLIHAAIINKRFRESLLNNPKHAIETGYLGESFQFSNELKEHITFIQTNSLEDFSTQILSIVDTFKKAEVSILQYQ